MGALRRAVLGLVLLLAGCAGDGPPPGESSSTGGEARAPLSPEPDVVRFAGSGAAGPLLRALAARLGGRIGGARIVVEQSIGTGGGFRAVVDGAVDAGLLSRPLKPEEARIAAANDLEETEIGVDLVVLAAHPDLAGVSPTGEALCALYAGEAHRLDGRPAVALHRDPAESANRVLDQFVPGMGAARAKGLRRGARVLYHDDDLLAALARTAGSVGVTSIALLAESGGALQPLPLDGRAPPSTPVARRGWPLRRPIALLCRAERCARLRPLFDLLATPDGRDAVQAAGYDSSTRTIARTSHRAPPGGSP